MKAYIKAGNTSSKIGTYIKAKSSYDPDAQAFITAASLTDNTQKNAINNFVINCKAAGIWTKFKAIYPMVGGTATTHKWNLKNPADTNASFRLVFSGGWTHSSTGATPNGVNAYADTFLVPNTVLTQNSTHISYYSRTNSNLTEIEIGASNGPNATDDKLVLEIRTSGVTYYNINSTTTYIQALDTDSRAFYIGNRTASNVVNGWRNSSKLATGTTASTTPSTANVYLGAFNRTSSVALYSNKECAFASIGDGLTDTEALVFNQIVEGYQYELGRSNNPLNVNYYNTAYNNETNAFLYASQITDNTQKSAVNTFVNDLKTAGIWTKMKAVYPFVGGTATTHKWNLVDPQDTNAAFRLSFIGGWTHNSTGALANGTNAYANTFLIPNTNVGSTIAIGSYNSNITNALAGYISGCQNSTTQTLRHHILSTQHTFRTPNLSSNTTPFVAAGFNGGSRFSTTLCYAMSSNGTTASDTTTQTGVLPTFAIYLAALNNSGSAGSYGGLYFNTYCASTGLSIAEMQNLRTAFITFNSTLGR